MTDELAQLKQAAVKRLEERARIQAAEDKRIYLEGVGFLYLVAVLLISSDVDNLLAAVNQAAEAAPPIQDDAAGRERAALVAEDRGMLQALQACRAALLEVMPQLAGPVLASTRAAVGRLNADAPFDQIVNAVGPHGLAYLAASFGAARIARNAVGATPAPTEGITH